MHGIKANFIYNLIGTIVPLIVALITVPIYVSHIGSARYGVLSIVWILLGYFGFLDLGLSRASANALAKLAHSTQHERSQVLITAFCINLCIGTIGGIVLFFSASSLLDHLLTVPADLKYEIDNASPWIASLLPLLLVSGVGTGALEAREQFLAANVLQVTGNTIAQALTVLSAVLISPSLSVVIPAAVLSRGLSVLIIVVYVVREERPLSLRSFDRKRCRQLLGYGGWVSVSNIVSSSPYIARSIGHWLGAGRRRCHPLCCAHEPRRAQSDLGRGLGSNALSANVAINSRRSEGFVREGFCDACPLLRWCLRPGDRVGGAVYHVLDGGRLCVIGRAGRRIAFDRGVGQWIGFHPIFPPAGARAPRYHCQVSYVGTHSLRDITLVPCESIWHIRCRSRMGFEVNPRCGTSICRCRVQHHASSSHSTAICFYSGGLSVCSDFRANAHRRHSCRRFPWWRSADGWRGC